MAKKNIMFKEVKLLINSYNSKIIEKYLNLYYKSKINKINYIHLIYP